MTSWGTHISQMTKISCTAVFWIRIHLIRIRIRIQVFFSIRIRIRIRIQARKFDFFEGQKICFSFNEF